MDWIGIFVAAAGIGIWLWARSPFHHRKIRQGELSEFFENLLRDGDGSLMTVEDERTRRSVVIEKRYSDSEILVFGLSGNAHGQSLTALGDSLEAEGLEHRSATPNVDRFELEIDCDRNMGAGRAYRTLVIALGWLGSSASSTYHVYFDAKRDVEGSRKHFEGLLADPATSALRKEMANKALDLLDKRLDGKKSKRRASGRRRS